MATRACNVIDLASAALQGLGFNGVYEGLQDKIKLIQIDLWNRPDWYKKRVYPTNKVPSLEHYNKVIRESLDLVKYVDSNFEGSSLLLNVRCKSSLLSYLFRKILRCRLIKRKYLQIDAGRKFFDELIANSDTTFIPGVYRSFARDARTLVDIADAPFIERLQIFMPEGFNYDITIERPKFAKWIKI
ncbi:hypothetical protein RDI58_014764 [Solanum bulbocastanum]|uniref:GST N-terminal domain-containing protein n=1 Tax=Solanum bulbocastanum TaxID=147425 RepID=A0AAN8TE19_SOLBU